LSGASLPAPQHRSEVRVNVLPMTSDSWLTGLTLDEYIAGMKMNQATMARRLASVQLTPAERDAFARSEGSMHVLVMTEDWCGDAVMNLPIVARIVEALPRADLRVFVRPAAPELNAYYADRGVSHIPVVSFLQEDFREVGVWVERPRTADVRRSEWMAAHPDLALGKPPAELAPEERQQRMRLLMELLAEMESWYDNGIQSDTVAEIRVLLGHEVKK
jgi:hypothetical protein